MLKKILLDTFESFFFQIMHTFHNKFKQLYSQINDKKPRKNSPRIYLNLHGNDYFFYYSSIIIYIANFFQTKIILHQDNSSRNTKYCFESQNQLFNSHTSNQKILVFN